MGCAWSWSTASTVSFNPVGVRKIQVAVILKFFAGMSCKQLNKKNICRE